ncbi:MAG: hypothetical protein HYS13_04415 [Planctomycetia bacterium]|nr:hypothetical protein [Planctomycetia bacterium]
MNKIILMCTAAVMLFGSVARAQNGDWAVARPVYRTQVARQVPAQQVPVQQVALRQVPAQQVQVVRYQTVDASGVPVEYTVTSSPVYASGQTVQALQTVPQYAALQPCQCVPVCQTQTYTAGLGYEQRVPVAVYRPLLGLGSERPVYIGRGVLGQPKAFVEGQPVRNAIRWIMP